MSKTEVGIQHIQKQVDHCDKIVDNIDIIVPKLYKIRQQVLAQKDYINDVSRDLLTNGTNFGLLADGGNLTLKTYQLGTTLVKEDWATKVWNTDNEQKNREVIQSLFKYKHEIGTSNHFTTEQIGLTADRTYGLNLRDVVNITTGLNNLLTSSNSTPATNSTLDNIILKSGTYERIVPSDTSTSFITNAPTGGGPEGTGYGNVDGDGLPTNLVSATGNVSGKIVGFGLT